MPWPVKNESQTRIKEALSLWETRDLLCLCLVEPCGDPFLKGFDSVLLAKNSCTLGTKIKKCFISDMVETLIQKYPQEDFYGFGNSDLVPVGDFSERQEYQALAYHRTEIEEWEYRLPNSQESDTENTIRTLRFAGHKDKKIARMMNIKQVNPPDDEKEWTYETIRKVMKKQGEIFFWGQDLFLFRHDVVQKILDEYLKVKNPILGTGGFDPRLTRYLMENYDGARVLHRIFHKKHTSEWMSDEVEFFHNGGEIPQSEMAKYYDHKYLLCIDKEHHKPVVPAPMRQYLRKSDPNLYDKLSKL